MREYIGGVCLDLTYDSGDTACADERELDEILRIVQTVDKRDFGRVIADRRSERLLYYLSAQRQNIAAGLEIGRNQKILEIGSECGIVTDKLARKAKSVTCIDPSAKKCRVNAYRNRAYDNIEIYAGSFEAVCAQFPDRYDIVTLIGVLGDIRNRLGCALSAENLLRTAKDLLKPDGMLVLALDNKYGLKYWAGCRDECRHEFFGNLKAHGDSREDPYYSLNRIKKMLKDAELEDMECFYPYPDYRYARSIYSDEYLPSRGELTSNMNNYGESRMVLFDEGEAYDHLISDGLFPLFSNSYLIVCRRKDTRQ
ncbi:MAG: class I SAM-dependent methyltransferase [Lachnospiraceae bacterium]|nr:class I SAM-dependent methyltransferase [Lachnospiraceae bacterium]